MLQFLTTISLLVLCVSAAFGQGDPFNSPGSTTTTVTGYENRQGTNIQVTVFNEKSRKLDRQSLVKLSSKELLSVNWQTTNELSEVVFGEIPNGHYDIEVSAVGYLPVHQEVQVISSWAPVRLEVNLQKDPSAVNLSIEETGLPKSARKNAKHGVEALKAGKWNEADKNLQAAYKLAPENPDLNFLLGYVFYEKKDYGQAKPISRHRDDSQAQQCRGAYITGTRRAAASRLRASGIESGESGHGGLRLLGRT